MFSWQGRYQLPYFTQSSIFRIAERQVGLVNPLLSKGSRSVANQMRMQSSLEIVVFENLRIEARMSKRNLGKSLIVLGAGLSFVLSVGLWVTGQREEGLFVGIWVPSILSFGTLLFAGKGVAS